jgi:hypothetical protein
MKGVGNLRDEWDKKSFESGRNNAFDESTHQEWLTCPVARLDGKEGRSSTAGEGLCMFCLSKKTGRSKADVTWYACQPKPLQLAW